jgi:hypothetical protein
MSWIRNTVNNTGFGGTIEEQKEEMGRKTVLWIRTGFNADPDPGSQTNADPDAGFTGFT